MATLPIAGPYDLPSWWRGSEPEFELWLPSNVLQYVLVEVEKQTDGETLARCVPRDLSVETAAWMERAMRHCDALNESRVIPTEALESAADVLDNALSALGKMGIERPRPAETVSRRDALNRLNDLATSLEIWLKSNEGERIEAALKDAAAVAKAARPEWHVELLATFHEVTKEVAKREIDELDAAVTAEFGQAMREQLPAECRTVGDVWKALHDGRTPAPPAGSAVSIRPGPCRPKVSFAKPEEETKRMALETVLQHVDAEGGDKAAAIQKLIARVALKAGADRQDVVNMPIVEFAERLSVKAPSSTTPNREPPKRKRGRQPSTDRALDRRIATARANGRFPKNADLASEFRLSESEIVKALDRDRRRKGSPLKKRKSLE